MALSADHPRLRDTVAMLDRLIAYPTISGETNVEMIEEAAGYLEYDGASVKVWRSPDGTRANCLATIGPEIPGGIMLSGHSDVVPVTGQEWTYDPFQMIEEGGRLYGRGTCDMKGFLAAAMAMASDFAALPVTRPLHIALTYDEETGCMGGLQLAADMIAEDIRPSVCIVGEPTRMQVIEGHKGCYEYTTRFRGFATHGSLTHLGVNAVEYAARYICRLMDIREHLKNASPEGQRFEPPYTTLQIGQVYGGVSRNTIAGECSVEWEMRPIKISDADHVKASIQRYVEEELLPEMRERHPDAAIDLETVGEVVGLTPATESEARHICTSLTGSEETGVVSFGTEAGIYANHGISTVVCGPGSIEQAHKPDEFIELSELGRCLHMLDALKSKLTDR